MDCAWYNTHGCFLSMQLPSIQNGLPSQRRFTAHLMNKVNDSDLIIKKALRLEMRKRVTHHPVISVLRSKHDILWRVQSSQYQKIRCCFKGDPYKITWTQHCKKVDNGALRWSSTTCLQNAKTCGFEMKQRIYVLDSRLKL